jgi:hypothetical protein
MKPLYLVIAYVALLHLGPIMNLFGLIPGARVYPITTTGHLLMVYLALRYFVSLRWKGLSRLDMAVIAFLGWSLASFVLYFQKDNPTDIRAYFMGVHLYVMPIFGYFAIRTASAADQFKALRFVLWSNVFLLAIGLYLWWARPAFYTIFLRDVVFGGLEGWSDWMLYLRMQSYLASTVLGVLCAITVAITGTLGLAPWKTIIVLSLAIPSVILTYQRGGQAGTLLAMIYLALWGKGSRAMRPIILGTSLLVGIAGVVYLAGQSDVGLEYYLERKNDYNSNLMEGRRGYTVGLDYVTAFPLGVGLGGSGNAASGAGLAQWDKVVDANYMRIFADLGVQGLLMFLVILGLGVEAALRKRKNPGIACIIVIFALVAIGTNVLDGHLTPQLFWLVLGMADTREGALGPEAARVPAARAKAEDDASLLQPSPQHKSGPA